MRLEFQRALIHSYKLWGSSRGSWRTQVKVGKINPGRLTYHLGRGWLKLGREVAGLEARRWLRCWD